MVSSFTKRVQNVIHLCTMKQTAHSRLDYILPEYY